MRGAGFRRPSGIFLPVLAAGPGDPCGSVSTVMFRSVIRRVFGGAGAPGSPPRSPVRGGRNVLASREAECVSCGWTLVTHYQEEVEPGGSLA